MVLRRWRKGGGVIALFPDVLASMDGLLMSYQQVGQHGAADYQHVISKTLPVPVAEPDQERDELLAELQAIGYNPVGKQRRARIRR